VEAIPVTHSIMDAVSVVIHTVLGAIIHTGDFKFDSSPVDGRMTELHRFARLGDEGVLLLSSDSTNATRPGSGASESSVGPALKMAMAGCSGKIVVTTFASNMFRIQQIIDAAIANGRKVALAGRSLERNVDVTRQLCRLNIPENALIDVKAIRDIPDAELLIIATGSQGEFRAALARIAHDRFKEIHLKTGDLVIFSSSAIPGNERSITHIFNHIARRGARIMHAGQAPLHVSGHAASHELKTMIQLTRPKNFYPVHGEYRYLTEHRDLALATGVPFERTVIAENGQCVELDREGVRLGDTFHVGAVYVDGTSRDEIDYAVLRDRRAMATDGMVSVTVVVSQHEGKVLGEPEIVARGVLRESISEHVLEEIALGLKAYLNTLEKEFLSDTEEAREEVRLWVRRWIKREIGARPMILPAVIEI
ncbi:MAG: RNase J family beta-CASP ribonuclease, partial [Zetaproteobacteria bacterium CG02_land_8_20_14_3_00_50_9]